MTAHKHEQLIGAAYLAGARAAIKWSVDTLRKHAPHGSGESEGILQGAANVLENDNPFKDDE